MPVVPVVGSFMLNGTTIRVHTHVHTCHSFHMKAKNIHFLKCAFIPSLHMSVNERRERRRKEEREWRDRHTTHTHTRKVNDVVGHKK